MARPRKNPESSAPSPGFVGEGAFRRVDLKFPVRFEGQTYDSVRIRRMTMGELRAFLEAIEADAKTANLDHLLDCPPALLDHLDADDYDKLQKEIAGFLPRRLQPDPAANDEKPAPQNGDTTQPSSPPSSDGASPT